MAATNRTPNSNYPQQEPVCDTGAEMPQTSYEEQYNREGAAKLQPFRGVDRDIAQWAAILEQNAAKQAGRSLRPVTNDEV